MAIKDRNLNLVRDAEISSYYKPEDSWWYVQDGPKNLRHRQMLLLVSQGFERKETVGFRCVAELEN